MAATDQPERVAAKVAYVKAQGQTRRHHCHWPGCQQQVPPAMWGWRHRSYSLPITIRTAIWRNYRAGQEVNGTPSSEYVAAAKAAQQWIAANHPPATPAQGTLP